MEFSRSEAAVPGLRVPQHSCKEEKDSLFEIKNTLNGEMFKGVLQNKEAGCEQAKMEDDCFKHVL